MAAQAAGRRWGIRQRRSGRVTLSARRSPAATARGAALCPPNPGAPVGRRRSRGARAFTMRAACGVERAPGRPRFLAVGNASRGGSPRNPSGPGSRGRSGHWGRGQGNTPRPPGAWGTEGGWQVGLNGHRGPQGTHKEPSPLGQPRCGVRDQNWPITWGPVRLLSDLVHRPGPSPT